MSAFSKFKGTIAGAVAAPFTGGLSLIAGAGYDYMNAQKNAVKKQNQLNQQQAQLQNQLAKENWDITNAYNSPKEQMERLAAAGLNPNLVYGGGNVTGNSASSLDASAVGSMSAFNQADSIVKTLPILQGFANLRNTNTQNELLQYQMGQTQAQTDNFIAQNANIGVQNRIMEHNLKYAQDHGLPVGNNPTWDSGFGSILNYWTSNNSKRFNLDSPSNGPNLIGKLINFMNKTKN